MQAVEYRAENPEVLISTADPTLISQGRIAELAALAKANPSRRIRLCAHPDLADPIHEMLVVHPAEAYVRPHKHLCRSESLHLLQGRLKLFLFDNRGVVEKLIRLGPPSGEEPFYYRLGPGRFHHLVVDSETAVFHETTNGPFVPEETTFAPWSPEVDDQAGITAFRASLLS